MRLFSFLGLLGLGFADINAQKKLSFQEYTDIDKQNPLEIWEDDKKAVSFNFEIISPETTENPFEIQDIRQQNGKLYAKLRAITILNREKVDSYDLMLESVDASGRRLNTLEVTINVLDVNNNAPVIDSNTLTLEMKEDAEEGTEIGLIRASDKDEGKFAILEFSKLDPDLPDEFIARDSSGSQYQKSFDIETVDCLDENDQPSKCGRVILKKRNEYMDAEKYKEASFKIIVRDDPENTGAHASTKGKVHIKIRDVNDNVPRFELVDVDSTSVIIDETAEIGYVIPIDIPVTDDDVDETNSKIQLGVKDSDLFIFNEENELLVNGELDYESQKEHQITITARNPGANDNLVAETIISIILKDSNEPPRCSPFFQNWSPIENTDNSGVVGKMICDDGDSGLQSLSYSLSDEAEFFDIDQNSGEIKLVDFADREWNAKQNGIDDYKNDGIHQVTVFVKDNGRDPEPKESQIIVDIKISDVADEPPMFGRGIYQNVLKICSDPQLLQQEEIIVADPDENGEIISITVSDGTTDLTESFVPSKIDEKTWHLTYAGQLKSFTGALEKLVLTATDGHGESTINEFNVQICSCSADGEKEGTCAAGIVTKKSSFPWWIIILIVALIVGIIIIAALVAKRNNVQKSYDQDPEAFKDMEDQGPLLSLDTEGGEQPNNFDGNQIIVNPTQKTGRAPSKSRPDGDLGDIINQCKDAADKEEIVPNALLSFEFEGRNSIISNLSSLDSDHEEEANLDLENLPDTVKKHFN